MPPTIVLVDFFNFFSRSPMLSIASQVRWEGLDEHDKCHWGAMMICTGRRSGRRRRCRYWLETNRFPAFEEWK